jgi:hypothetical protein
VADTVGSYELALAVHDGRVYRPADRVAIEAAADLVAVPAVAGLTLEAAETALVAAGSGSAPWSG